MSLRFKLMMVIAALVLVLGLGGTFHARLTLASISEKRLKDQGVAIASSIAAHSAEMLLTNDTFGLYQEINRALVNNEEVRYVFVVDRAGEVRASSFERGLPEGLREANAAQAGQQYTTKDLESTEGTLVDIAAPILGGKAGTVRVGLSKRSLETQVDQLTFNLMSLTEAVLLGGVILAYFLAMILTRPLARLAEAARAIGRGDLSRRVAAEARDEVGRLATAFNRMAEDLAHSRQELQAVNDQVLRQNVELATLNAVALAVSRSLDVQQVLEAALGKVLEVMNLDTGWVLIANGASGARLVAQRGLPTLPSNGDGAQEVACPCLLAMRGGDAAVVTMRGPCPRLQAGAAPAAKPCGHAALPLLAREQVLGIMCLAVADVEQLGPDSQRLLASIGRYVGVALDNARLYEEVQRRQALHSQLLAKVITAQEEERKRVARELHDESAQALTALLMGLESLQGALPAHANTARERLEDTLRLAAGTLAETRRLIYDLRPTVLDDLGLLPAIRLYAESRFAPSEVNLEVQAELRQRLTPELETTLFRILQEAINNCARHAVARNVLIRVEQRGGKIVGLIEDDGIGFNVEAALGTKEGHLALGLLGMQERAALLGGRLEIRSAPGRGTQVYMELPMPEGESDRGQDSRAGG